MEGISILSFAAGSIMQFFLLCSSVQTLSDAVRFILSQLFFLHISNNINIKEQFVKFYLHYIILLQIFFRYIFAY